MRIWGTIAVCLLVMGCGEGKDDDTDVPPVDSDGDGFDITTDCNDDDGEIHPEAVESPNDGVDQNCDGEELCPIDADGDGYGDINGATTSSPALDCVGESVSPNADDCNDESADYYPSAPEDDCTDPNDYNCDGSTGYADADDDGYAACEDCDDGDENRNPGVAEIAGDEFDQNCDGGEICFQDGDDDGHRPDETSTVVSEDVDCQDAGEADQTEPTDDCDDTDENAYLGAPEIWYDGKDQDCLGGSDYDQDGDGYDSDKHEGLDCDDLEELIHPKATEIRQNGVDEDCDGTDAPYIVSDLSAGDLVVTEIMRDPKQVKDEFGEWFEVLNNSGGELDLEDLYVYDDGSESFTVTGSLLVADGDFVVLGMSTVTSVNGGAAVDYSYGRSGYTLGEADDAIYLADSSAKTTIIDEVVWDGDYFPDSEGYAASMDDQYDTALNNDHEGNWCDASSTYGRGDRGTPGTSNDSCNFTYVWSDVSRIFGSKCDTCHTTGSSGGMTGITSWSTVVWTPANQSSTHYRVDPFSSADSYLWMKLQGTASTGATMPKTGSLSTAQKTTIKTWIDEGAPQ